MNPILPQKMGRFSAHFGLKQVGLRRNNPNLELPDAGTDWASGGLFWFKQDGFETLILMHRLLRFPGMLVKFSWSAQLQMT